MNNSKDQNHYKQQIEEMEKIYNRFLVKLEKFKKVQDEKIKKVLEEIEQEKIQEVLNKIKNN